MRRDEFLAELVEYEESFRNQKPVLEFTARDSSLNLEGFVVVWNLPRTPDAALGVCAKGGTRIHRGLTLDEVAMLAKVMALKNAAARLPIGGAKSGLRANPRGLHFEQQYRRFAQLAKPILVQNGGPFGGFGLDYGADPAQSAWVIDELDNPRVFTGKPVELGGTDYDNEGIAGLGVAVSAAELLKLKGRSAGGATFAVPGLGAMGAAVIRHFTALGGTLGWVSDPKVGGSYRLRKAPSEELLAAIAERDHEPVRTMLQAEGERTDEDSGKVLFADVDVVFPCAVQNVLTAVNAGDVNASFVVEGANNPCQPAAREILFERGVPVVPDFIANAGGIISAYVEMITDVSAEENARTRRIVQDAIEMTRDRIAANVQYLLELAEEYKIPTVRAAQYIAWKQMYG